MRLVIITIPLALTGWFVITSVFAQDYSPPQQDPCRPASGLWGAVVPMPDQRRAACLAERKAQWDAYNAQQQALAQRQAAAQAAQEAAQQAELRAEQAKEKREEAERLAAERRQEREALIQRRNAYTELISEENAPDNHCKTPDIARMLLQQWSDFDQFKNADLRAIDIEHLTTKAFDPVNSTMTCHGVFVTNTSLRLIGSMEVKKNVAGDPIVTWISDDSQDLAAYNEPPPVPDEPQLTPTMQPERISTLTDASPSPDSATQSASFVEGLANRKSWEAWIEGLPEDEARGAKWWAANRNVPNHSTCAAESGADAAFTAGCHNAQGRLTEIDLKRRSDPEFRKGWNSL